MALFSELWWDLGKRKETHETSVWNPLGKFRIFPNSQKILSPLRDVRFLAGTCGTCAGRAPIWLDFVLCFHDFVFSWNNYIIWKLYSHMAVLVLSIITFSSRTIDSTDHAKTQNKRKHYACSGPSETSLDCFPIAHRFFHGRGWPEWLDDVDGFGDIGFRKNVQNWFLKIGEKSKTHVPSGWDVRQENAYWSISA